MNRNKNGKAAPKAARSQMAKKAVPRKQTQKSVSAAYATGQSTGKAQVYRNSVDSCRIVHRELVGSIIGSAAFTVASTLAINPGLSASFPWLSTQAQGWEKYRFNSLKLCYYTRTGSNIPGSVILSPDYDAAEAAPVNEAVACASYGTEEDAPWKDISLVHDPGMLATLRYVRTGALAANLDIKTYDVGNDFVCTIDGTAVAWGKLWFEYDITLFDPQLPPGGPVGSGVIVAGGGTLAAATPMGAVPVSTGSYALAASATNVLAISGLTIGQEYLVTYMLGGTVITNCTLTAPSGMTVKSASFNCFNAAATAGTTCATYTATSGSATLTISVTATTVVNGYLVVSALSPAPSI